MAQENGELYHLRYRFEKGEQIAWQVVHKATVQTTIQGTSQTAITRSESVKVWEIADVSPEGEFTLVHTVASVNMSNQIGSRAEVVYDSTTDASPPAGFEQAAGAVGVPLTEVRVSAAGRILHRQDKRPQVAQSEDMPIAIPFPDKPIPIGHVWIDPHDVQVILDGGGTHIIKTRQEYELKDVRNDVATISIKYQVLSPLNDPKIEAQLVQRLANGTIRFDLKTGRLISQQRDVDKRVLGFGGAASSMHYEMRFTEVLLKEHVDLAARTGPDPQ